MTWENCSSGPGQLRTAAAAGSPCAQGQLPVGPPPPALAPVSLQEGSASPGAVPVSAAASSGACRGEAGRPLVYLFRPERPAAWRQALTPGGLRVELSGAAVLNSQLPGAAGGRLPLVCPPTFPAALSRPVDRPGVFGEFPHLASRCGAGSVLRRGRWEPPRVLLGETPAPSPLPGLKELVAGSPGAAADWPGEGRAGCP